MPNEPSAAERTLITEAYRLFNARDIDAALSLMATDVEWPNGFEGGYVHGQAAVRDYWTRQWKLIDPSVEPLELALSDDGRLDVTVHQVVREVATGNVLNDRVIHHIWRLEDGLVAHMEIG